jgi:hypothetical protein
MSPVRLWMFRVALVVSCLGAIRPASAFAQDKEKAVAGKELRVQGEITDKDADDPGRPGSFHKTYTFKMEAGKGYRIDFVSRETEGFDPYLRLLDPAGKVVGQDDDGGGFPNSRLFHKAAQTGDYKIICTTFGQNMVGKFSLVVLPATEAEMKAAPVAGPPGVPIAPPVPPGQAFKDVPATHKQIAEIKVRSTDGKNALQTVGIDAEGRALALTAPPKGFTAPTKDATSEIHVFNPDGKAAGVWKVPFHANSVATGPKKTVLVAGDGKIAQFDRDGKILQTVDLPHIAAMLKDTAGMRKQAEDQLKQQQAAYTNIIKQLQDRNKTIEAKKEEDRTNLEKRQLTQNLSLLKTYEQMAGGKVSEASIDAIVAQLTGRLRTINSVTVSTQDIFIACGDNKGFGYSVWRMGHDFTGAKQVLSGIGGCCGQMDINTSGGLLLVAENTKHRFACYDRDGKLVSAGGKRGPETQLECFGSCCNPMNLCANSAGDIFTAESEGVIKRFSPKGEFLGLVAVAKMTGAGCKNVAFAVSPDESRIYFLDLPSSRFLIMEKTK